MSEHRGARDAGHQEQLRTELLRRREAILNRDRLERVEVRAEAETVKSNVFDEAEASAFDLQTDLDLALLELTTETIRQIDHALARINDGAYGICADCGRAIPAARLRALPAAECCLRCEKARESIHGRSQPLGGWRRSKMPFAVRDDRRACR